MECNLLIDAMNPIQEADERRQWQAEFAQEQARLDQELEQELRARREQQLRVQAEWWQARHEQQQARFEQELRVQAEWWQARREQQQARFEQELREQAEWWLAQREQQQPQSAQWHAAQFEQQLFVQSEQWQVGVDGQQQRAHRPMLQVGAINVTVSICVPTCASSWTPGSPLPSMQETLERRQQVQFGQQQARMWDRRRWVLWACVLVFMCLRWLYVVQASSMIPIQQVAAAS